MSNNVRHVSFGARAPAAPSSTDSHDEPTELQRAVLARARELRERESRPRTRSPAQWAAAALLALVCFGIMYGAVDAVLRKMQRLTKDYAEHPVAVTEPAATPAQSQSPNQPYFVDLQPSGSKPH